MKKILIGCDHAGFPAKQPLIDYLTSEGYELIDCGTYTADSCDYPLNAHATCKRLLNGEAECAILICGTGIGISIAANKHKGIRAALCGDLYSAEMSRQHNAANVLCMGARVIDIELMKQIADKFLTTDSLSTDRHVRRQQQLSAIEDGTIDDLSF
ncbi:MAG: ribose 5-phosphate isomerase B [Clostridia bacterium]|nr:ribose 5-phosphate isomerase B [Clostridia bacterium]